MTVIYGCDVSGWQVPDPDYTGLDFVYVKSTQGTVLINPNHDEQVAKARREGRIVGHYHWPAWGDPVAEARAFVSLSGIQPGDFLVLDIESSSDTPWPADPVTWCCRWEDEVHRLTQCWPMDYCGRNVTGSWDWSPLAVRGGGRILPAYNPTGPGDPSPWPFVAMWQNADTNVSGGDSDQFFGDRATLARYGVPGAPDITGHRKVYQWPANPLPLISQPFGVNPGGLNPPGGHDGLDIAVPVGTVLYAPGDGFVQWCGVPQAANGSDNPWWMVPGGGLVLGIDCGDTEPTFTFGHLSELLVRAGEKVVRGQPVCVSGQSGNASGPHCHFEALPPGYILNSPTYGRVDPTVYCHTWDEAFLIDLGL